MPFCCAAAVALSTWQAVPPAGAITTEQLLFLEAWRAVDRAYVDKSFNGQSWFRVSWGCRWHCGVSLFWARRDLGSWLSLEESVLAQPCRKLLSHMLCRCAPRSSSSCQVMHRQATAVLLLSG